MVNRFLTKDQINAGVIVIINLIRFSNQDQVPVEYERNCCNAYYGKLPEKENELKMTRSRKKPHSYSIVVQINYHECLFSQLPRIRFFDFVRGEERL